MNEHESEHQLSYRFLGLILGALILLTGLTVAVSYVDWGFLNVPIALFVASSKATLVLLFFMHIKYEGLAIKVSFISTVLVVALMISFTFWDVAFR
ncbi:MAG: cytochrome C oxidase subunit IV family protein [Desulfocapsaceae bacterium]|nr:cytochrome C oxidase subunit IV family protein [Desulfocapsaceae bacterium]